MNFKTKKNGVTKSLYIILMLCITGIIVLSIYSLFATDNNTPVESDKVKLDNKNNSTSENGSLLQIFTTTEKAEESTVRPPQESTTSERLELLIPEEIAAVTTEAAVERVTEAAVEIEPAATDSAAIDSAVNEPAVEVIAVPAVFMKPALGALSNSYTTEPEYSVHMNDYRTHLGIDIDAEVGTPVKAAAQGEITKIYDDPMMGTTIIMTHGGGYMSIYMNLQENIPQNIREGSIVAAGEIIGGVGETSLVEIGDTPHLHFAMQKDGAYVNPLDYVEY